MSLRLLFEKLDSTLEPFWFYKKSQLTFEFHSIIFQSLIPQSSHDCNIDIKLKFQKTGKQEHIFTKHTQNITNLLWQGSPFRDKHQPVEHIYPGLLQRGCLSRQALWFLASCSSTCCNKLTNPDFQNMVLRNLIAFFRTKSVLITQGGSNTTVGCLGIISHTEMWII